MNKAIRIINPELEACSSEDEDSIEFPIINYSHNSKTSQCSTQVNMDAQFEPQGLPRNNKKERKKEYKRKKKQKQKQAEKQAKIELTEIIAQMYLNQAKFSERRAQIEAHLSHLVSGNKFHSFLNHTIRTHVNNIQKYIWDYMQEIIHENPFEKSDDDQEFYLLMVDEIYKQYQNLHEPSLEIEKIINLFMCMKQNTQQYHNRCNSLDRSTFNYLIESDETIKNLIRICDRRISRQHQQQIMKLKEIQEIVTFDENGDYYAEQEEYITEKSTSVEDEETEDKNTKRKRRKVKKADFSTSMEDVIRRLNDLVIIEQNRASCCVEDDWLNSLQAKFQIGNQKN